VTGINAHQADTFAIVRFFSSDQIAPVGMNRGGSTLSPKIKLFVLATLVSETNNDRCGVRLWTAPYSNTQSWT
jgi:hypothetical protein